MVQKRFGIVLFVVVVAFIGFIGCPPPPHDPRGPPEPPGPPGPRGPAPMMSMDPMTRGEYVLFVKLFSPDAEPMGPEGTENVLGQLEKLYMDRIRTKKPKQPTPEELRRRTQVFSLVSMAEIDPSHCTDNRFYAISNSIEFLSQYPNIVTYLRAKQQEQLRQCMDSNPNFRPPF